MRNTLSLFTLAAVLSLASHSAQATLLTNGNLDVTQPVEIVPGFFLPKPASWVNEGFRAISGPYEDEMSSEPWAGPAPTPVTADGSGLPGPDGCDGPDCAVFFKPFSGNAAPNGPTTGHLYQDVPGTPGLEYTLTGWAGAESNALMTGAEMALEFLDGGGSTIGGTVVNLLPTLFVDNGEPFDYKQYTASAVAPANTAFVRARVSMIGAMGNPAGGGQAYVVDDFELTAIPEPSTLALVLVGIIRRRR
ncbi:MAG TPA: hypothetical protein VNT79_05440 [Phycisphaerae bacterium]|nr:hypothetical protein [Phycisphaerae bacterium]